MGGRCAHIEKVKKEAPIVGLTLREKVLPTCLKTSDVFPTPADKDKSILPPSSTLPSPSSLITTPSCSTCYIVTGSIPNYCPIPFGSLGMRLMFTLQALLLCLFADTVYKGPNFNKLKPLRN